MIGLHSVHYVLSENLDFDAFLRSIRGVGISLRENDRTAAWTSAPNDVAKVARNETRVLDQSLSGYRVQWDRLENLRIKVGELVALAPPGEDGEAQDWMIGAVRWIRFIDAGAMEAGIALLSRRALPVGVRTFDAARAARAPMRGLLLEPLASESAPGQRVLVPHLFDRNAAEVEIMRPPDPFDAVPEPRVDVLRAPRVLDRGSAYLQIVLSDDTPEGNSGDPPAGVSEDDLALAAGNG